MSRDRVSVAQRSMVTIMLGLVLGSLSPASRVAAQEAPAPRTSEEEQDTLQLPEIVVTATRVPLHRDALPIPVTVLMGDALREQGVETVADALRGVPGAAVARSGTEGAQTSLFLRGGESDYVKVLVDGVPVNEPGGAIDFADLSMDQVERIEVVRGPVSVLYGSDAVAGVVQIFTRRGRGEPALAVTATGGRGKGLVDEDGYGNLDAEATLSGAAGALSYAVGGGHSWTAGAYPFNSERRLNTGTARLGWSLSPATEVAFSTRYTDSESHFPTDGAGNVVDENAFIDRQMWTASLEAGHRLTDRLDARIQMGMASRRQVTVDRRDGPADTLGTYASELGLDVDRRTVDARLNAQLPATIATAGVTLEWSDAATHYDAESEWGPTESGASHDRSNRGYYGQLLIAPADALDLTIGGRIDDNGVFGTFRTYRLGGSWRLPWDTRLRAAIGRGFREPTFGENFGSGFGDLGNPELTPERSLSREIGLEHRPRPDLLLSATWFHQRFRDLIQFTSAQPEPGEPNYFNVGAAVARGLEVTAEGAAGPVVLTGSYTYLETEVIDPGLATDASFAEGQALLRRPDHAGSLTARYRLAEGALGFTLQLVGEREDVDYSGEFPAPRVTLPAYTTVDLSAEHALPLAFGPPVRALLRIENLTDTSHETVHGYPSPGRLVRLGARLMLGAR